MYEVYRLIALDKYFYVYTDKGISSLREGLNPKLMVTSLNLEEARVVTTALLEDRWNTIEELKVEQVDLGWNVYKFNRQGKPEYYASTKSITYFDVELEPVVIANNISKFDADLIARTLITKIENAQFENKVPQHLIDYAMSNSELNNSDSRVKPKGIVPKELNDQRFICDRFHEICEAIVEFKHANVRIPKDWLIELDGMFLDNDTHDLLEKGIC